MWAMSHEMVKEAIQNLSVLCDLRPSFSHLAVRLKNDYSKTGILNTEPDGRVQTMPFPDVRDTVSVTRPTCC